MSASSTKRDASLLSVSTGSASLMIALQVGSRGLTFIANQLLLRYLSPTLLGVSVQLEVYYITVLFFARESLRVAIQRQADIPDIPAEKETEGKAEKVPEGHVDGRTAAGRTQGIVNLAWISIYVGPIFALAFGLWYSSNVSAEVRETPFFELSLKLYGFAAVWELFSEPAFVVVQQKNRFRIRAKAESVGTLLRCLVTCGAAVWAAREGWDLGVLPFALGQAVYAAALILVYTWSVWDIASKGGFSLILKGIYSKTEGLYFADHFPWPLLLLGRSLFLQSIFKHILTQGDTLLISIFASPHAQGVYALANNYGGLVARLILQPIEESSRNYFGKLLSGTPTKDLVVQAGTNLQTLLHSYILLSVCIVATGPTIAPLLLKIVASSSWSSSGAGHVLSVYCYYIPLLAINGLTEAFVSSVATKSEVNRQTMWMLAFSAGFGGAAYIFLRVFDLGAVGLVWANTLNMVFRITWSTRFISGYLRRNGTQFWKGELFPKPTTLAAGVLTYAVLTQTEKTFTGGIPDFIKSGGVALGFAIILAISEREYILKSYQSLKSQRV